MDRSRYFENMYHNRLELENIETDFTLVVTSCIFDDRYAYQAFLFAQKVEKI